MTWPCSNRGLGQGSTPLAISGLQVNIIHLCLWPKSFTGPRLMFTAVKWTNPVLQDYEIVKMTRGRKEQTNVDRQVAISGKTSVHEHTMKRKGCKKL